MKRRAEESILDDCPRVSRARKAKLLAEYGSVAPLRRATPEQIADVAGINARLVEEIVGNLKTTGR